MMEHWGLPYYTNKAILEGIKDIYSLQFPIYGM